MVQGANAPAASTSSISITWSEFIEIQTQLAEMQKQTNYIILYYSQTKYYEVQLAVLLIPNWEYIYLCQASTKHNQEILEHIASHSCQLF